MSYLLFEKSKQRLSVISLSTKQTSKRKSFAKRQKAYRQQATNKESKNNLIEIFIYTFPLFKKRPTSDLKEICAFSSSGTSIVFSRIFNSRRLHKHFYFLLLSFRTNQEDVVRIRYYIVIEIFNHN